MYFSESLGELPPALRVLDIGYTPPLDGKAGHFFNEAFNRPLGLLPLVLTRLDLSFSTVFNQPLGHLPALLKVRPLGHDVLGDCCLPMPNTLAHTGCRLLALVHVVVLVPTRYAWFKRHPHPFKSLLFSHPLPTLHFNFTGSSARSWLQRAAGRSARRAAAVGDCGALA
jgi:hypothetical protein